MLNAFFWITVIIVISAIIEMVRRKTIREKYGFVWLTIAFLISLGAIFPNYVNKLSIFLGFQYLSNFVLFFFSIINLLLIMQLTLALGKNEQQSQTLAEEIALINQKIAELEYIEKDFSVKSIEQ